jgi:two-component system OmpR family response regulator
LQVLVVEDDPRVAEHVALGLKELNCSADWVANGEAALDRLGSGRYAALVLDRMLPGIDGLSVLRTIRTRGDLTPVLILSALGEVDDRVQGLRAGGDDYLVKPFALSELSARVEALIRRGSAAAGARLNAGPLEMDLVGREVRCGDQAIPLTDREFRLLEYLVRNLNLTVTRSMILEHVWDYRFDPQTNIIDQHISRLRQKLDEAGAPALIQTVRGAGYSLQA